MVRIAKTKPAPDNLHFTVTAAQTALDGGLFDEIRCVEIRFTKAEADDIVTQCAEFACHTGHFEGFGFG